MNINSRAGRAATKKVGGVAVCLIGYEGPQARKLGDNLGCWPVRVTVATRERDAAKKDDLSAYASRIVVLELVYVPTQEHARRLKAAIDEVLLELITKHDNGALRHAWRDVQGCFETPAERGQWWAEVLNQAERIVSRSAREFRMTSPGQRHLKIVSSMRGGQ